MRGGNRRGIAGKDPPLVIFSAVWYSSRSGPDEREPGPEDQGREVGVHDDPLSAQGRVRPAVRDPGGRWNHPVCTGDGGMQRESQGISSLLKGMPVQEAIQRMEGIRCRDEIHILSRPDGPGAQTVPVKEKGPRIPSVRRARGPLFLNRSAGQRRRRP